MERRKITCATRRIETSGSTARGAGRRKASLSAVPGVVEHEESDMISEIQVHVIARQMFEKHGLEAIVQAAQNAQACENKGDTEEAREWRHIEDMKQMRGLGLWRARPRLRGILRNVGLWQIRDIPTDSKKFPLIGEDRK